MQDITARLSALALEDVDQLLREQNERLKAQIYAKHDEIMKEIRSFS